MSAAPLPDEETDRPPAMTPSEVASEFRVSVATVRAWADDGRIPSFRTPGGQRRFRREDVEAFLKSQEPAA